MNLSQFSRKLRGQNKPSTGAVRTFKDSLEGTAPAHPSPSVLTRLANGKKRRRSTATIREMKAFMEGRASMPAGLKRRERLCEADEPQTFISKLKAARDAEKKGAPKRAHWQGVRNACLAILDDDSLSWEDRLAEIKELILGHAEIRDEDDEDEGDGKAGLKEWAFREWTLRDRRARKGAGLKGPGRLRQLLESACSPAAEVGADNVIRGVRIIGPDSKNGRRYTPEALRQAIPLYEGAKVNIDHPARPTDPRGVANRFGKLVNVRIDGDSLIGDLYYNPAHPMADTVRFWAANMPDMVGLSHNAVGEGHSAADGTFVVERIARVRSVDLVADPATTAGLF